MLWPKDTIWTGTKWRQGTFTKASFCRYKLQVIFCSLHHMLLLSYYWIVSFVCLTSTCLHINREIPESELLVSSSIDTLDGQKAPSLSLAKKQFLGKYAISAEEFSDEMVITPVPLWSYHWIMHLYFLNITMAHWILIFYYKWIMHIFVYFKHIFTIVRLELNLGI
jgi:hypothetical protein